MGVKLNCRVIEFLGSSPLFSTGHSPTFSCSPIHDGAYSSRKVRSAGKRRGRGADGVFCSVEVGPPAAKGEGRARRCYVSPNQLVESPAEGVHVLADILERSARLFPTKNALGWRDLVRMIEEEKEVKKVVAGVTSVETKKWSYFELSDYKYWTYADFATIVKKAASALVETGHTPDTIFNIYSGTSPRWQVMANGSSCAPPPRTAS